MSTETTRKDSISSIDSTPMQTPRDLESHNSELLRAHTEVKQDDTSAMATPIPMTTEGGYPASTMGMGMSPSDMLVWGSSPPFSASFGMGSRGGHEGHGGNEGEGHWPWSSFGVPTTAVPPTTTNKKTDDAASRANEGDAAASSDAHPVSPAHEHPHPQHKKIPSSSDVAAAFGTPSFSALPRRQHRQRKESGGLASGTYGNVHPLVRLRASDESDSSSSNTSSSSSSKAVGNLKQVQAQVQKPSTTPTKNAFGFGLGSGSPRPTTNALPSPSPSPSPSPGANANTDTPIPSPNTNDALYQAFVRQWCFAQAPGPSVGATAGATRKGRGHEDSEKEFGVIV